MNRDRVDARCALLGSCVSNERARLAGRPAAALAGVVVRMDSMDRCLAMGGLRSRQPPSRPNESPRNRWTATENRGPLGVDACDSGPSFFLSVRFSCARRRAGFSSAWRRLARFMCTHMCSSPKPSISIDQHLTNWNPFEPFSQSWYLLLSIFVETHTCSLLFVVCFPPKIWRITASAQAPTRAFCSVLYILSCIHPFPISTS